ncbi:Rieske (2Fe-2S) protein [Modestobacter marinus]|uniref:Cytochrome bc1 complex Rieske iron-sulfur subunit n=1 Tax=Modestobacter marinus TaxID=477641 RepID=A0A846LEM6_9ACTN|nr:Rieske (2Fe-2S) protein [Modestobacter marinus]NIH66087.1 nitrite reductase/ring-hydroxylating ferredoxin subunit [Modestobacter marinus]GGL60996.1 iron-sulfur protein [Modestobacter marinus]
MEDPRAPHPSHARGGPLHGGRTTRRSLLVAGGAGLGALGLGGCAAGPRFPEVTAAGPGDAVVPLAEVPVGGGYEVSVDGRAVLVTQPSAGTVAAFDAECPHAGCTVRATDDGLACPCHGSAFDPATGEVLRGPATEPLTAIGVAVQGPDVVLT